MNHHLDRYKPSHMCTLRLVSTFTCLHATHIPHHPNPSISRAVFVLIAPPELPTPTPNPTLQASRWHLL